jgi:hypothetical protein
VNGTYFATNGSVGGIESLFGLWILLPIGVAVGIWLLIASSRFVQGDTVNNDRVAQLYGYSVCLITLVTLLFVIPSLVDKALSFGSDGMEMYGMQSVRTFDAYKATRNMQSDTAKPYKSDAALRAEYDAVRTERLSSERSQSVRALVSGSITALLALGLFIFHWRWLRSRAQTNVVTQA